jgi:hypothetical protein
MERLRARFRGRGGQATPPGPGRERVPKRPKGGGRKRVPLDADISDVWAFAGRRLENTAHYPTGRLLQYQAPAAGFIVDEAVKGTLPDRYVLQPLARQRDKWETVGFMVAGPMVTYAITNNLYAQEEARRAGDPGGLKALQKQFDLLRETWVWVMTMTLPRLAPGVAKAREREERDRAAIAEAFPELAGEDPVEVLRAMLFDKPAGWSPPAPEDQMRPEESNGAGESFQGAGGSRPADPVVQ